MRGLIIFVFGLIFSLTSSGQKKFEATIDLKNMVDDKVAVEIIVPAFEEKTLIYQLPNATPGSYELADYTKYIENFSAYTANGEMLPVKTNKKGQYVIKQANSLKKITYAINDTWDDTTDAANYIFPPGGTQFEKNKVYLINHFGFLGYFIGNKSLPYSITYKKPNNLHASTPLNIKNVNDTIDIIQQTDYDILADNPVFYTNPDTLSFVFHETKINITTYSLNKIVKSEYLKPILHDVCQSISNFFGEMPVDEYSFYFYFAGNQEKDITKNESYGALEHKSNSVYFLPEIPVGEFLRSTILGIATHEFLHVLTPLQLHSKEISDFDFMNPDMSSHLWLYEGVTEYLSLWLLYTNNLLSKEDFILELRHKLIRSESYQNVPFTELSKNITKAPYNKMYNNVYNKGALIAFLLDIEINQLTNGEKNLQKVMLALYEKYKAQPFDDDSIIQEIVDMIHPDLGVFFNNYVKGTKPLPFGEYAEKIGWGYSKSQKNNLLTFGKINLSFNTELNAIVAEEMNPKQNMFHFKGGEIIYSVNDIEVSIDNFSELSEKITNPNTEDVLYLEVKKGDKLYTMEASPLLMPAYEHHFISEIEPKKPQQLNLYHNVFNIN